MANLLQFQHDLRLDSIFERFDFLGIGVVSSGSCLPFAAIVDILTPVILFVFVILIGW